MIDFSKIEVPVHFSTEEILTKIGEAQIFYRYFGPFELGKVYHSKFRKDSMPSTGFYLSKSGALIYNDFKTNEKLNCFKFVMKLFNVDFTTALKIIAQDFGLTRSDGAYKIFTNPVQLKEKPPVLIQFVPGKWTQTRVAYWMQYGITRDELVREEVYPVNRLFINKKEIKVDELCFAYIVRYEGKLYIKIYSPLSDRMKWLSNIPLSIPLGIDRLTKAEELIVSKANQKCRIILLKFFRDVLGAQNESEAAMRIILIVAEDYPKKTIIWDNDETGVNACKKFNDKGFGYFNIPAYLLDTRGIKDVSDYVKAFGLKAIERLFKSKGLISK